MKHIHVITGCMFAGKTTELINRLQALQGNYLLVKPKIDNRDAGNQVSTHNGIAVQAIRVERLSEIFNQLNNIQIVGVDEAQFFSKFILEDLKYLKSQNIQVVIAGLDKDYLNKPFKSMEGIMQLSDSITRLYARCNYCQSPASYSHRKNTNQKKQVLIGSENFYEALCESCFNKSNV